MKRRKGGRGIGEKNNLDVVNRKTQERERQVRVIGEEEEEEGGIEAILKMDVDVDVRG